MIGNRIWLAIFHSISAFCNAGFCLFSSSLEGYGKNGLVVIIVALLIIIGGIGFTVAFNILSFLKSKILRKKSKMLVHTRLVIITSLALIMTGTAAIYCIELNHAFAGFDSAEALLCSFFQSVTPRTAGFQNIDLAKFSSATNFIIIVLMFIGASPGSTGGGIKTTTLAVNLISLIAVIRGRKQPEVFNHYIRNETVQRVIAILALGMFTVGMGTFLLLITERSDLLTVLFEATSAFGTVGLSLNFTSSLSSIGKVIIIILMFIGRLGFLTVLLLMSPRTPQVDIAYPPARVLVG